MARKRRVIEPEAPPLSPLPPSPAPLGAAWRVAAALITLAYLVLSVGHLLVTPVARDSATNFTNAPDEAAHRVYVAAIAVGHRLPIAPHTSSVDGVQRRVEDPEFPTYEWHQPPLYYALASLLHGFGVYGERALGIVIGAAGIWVIFFAARMLFPDDPPLAVLAMGFAALMPMRQAITAAVGNDGATELTFSLTALASVATLRGGLSPARALWLGAALTAALLTKATALLLIPVIALLFLRLKTDGESVPSLVRGAGIIVALTLVSTSWWFIRNERLYGEVTPVRAFRQEFSGTSRAADWLGKPIAVDPLTGELVPSHPMDRLGYLELVATWTARTFFAAYTPPGRKAALGVPVFLPPAFYWPYALLVAIAVGGLLAAGRRRWTPLQRSAAWVLVSLALLVAGAFGAFAWEFFQATGRYLYPALLPIAIGWALGFRAALPPSRRDAASVVAVALMGLLAVAFLFSAVIPAYSPPS